MGWQVIVRSSATTLCQLRCPGGTVRCRQGKARTLGQFGISTERLSCIDDAHGIDTSAFNDTVSAFINQGVINSGQIGGNVATKVGSSCSVAPRVRVRGEKQRQPHDEY